MAQVEAGSGQAQGRLGEGCRWLSHGLVSSRGAWSTGDAFCGGLRFLQAAWPIHRRHAMNE
jgi:hypothetical protein